MFILKEFSKDRVLNKKVEKVERFFQFVPGTKRVTGTNGFVSSGSGPRVRSSRPRDVCTPGSEPVMSRRTYRLCLGPLSVRAVTRLWSRGGGRGPSHLDSSRRDRNPEVEVCGL